MSRLTILTTCLIALSVTWCADDFITPPLPDADTGVGDEEYDGDDELGGDGDVDSDGDSDADADDPLRDGGIDPAEPPPPPVVGVCFDGVVQDDRATLDDCEDPECLSAGRCCQSTERDWVDADLSSCVASDECGWTFFGGARPEDIDGEWLHLGPDSVSEAGIYSEALVELNAAAEISMRATLDPETCLDGLCRQVIGLALTSQQNLSVGTGVIPAAGLVIDGEQQTVSLYVAGRLESSVPMSRELLSQEHLYTLRVREDGAITFSVRGDEVDLEGETLSSLAWTADQVAPLRVVVFGRIEGTGAARVAEVRLERAICDSPRGFHRRSAQVMAPLPGEQRVGRPSVLRMPDLARLLMVHEVDEGLAASTSLDGIEWYRSATPFFEVPTASRHGQVSMGSPTVIYWGVEPGFEQYHLWYEAELESPEGANDDDVSSVIIHATSPDGFRWAVEDGLDIAISGDTSFPWRAKVGEPAVVAVESGLMMVFVGRNPITGDTRFGRAFSIDGKEWIVDDTPINFDEWTAPSFEGDGVGHPALVVRGGRLHLWYTVYDGSRAAIAYAIARQTNATSWSWSRLGLVFHPAHTWEVRRVAGPAVVTLPPVLNEVDSGDQVGLLTLWYQAGRQGRERLGMAQREIPTQVRDW